MLSGDREKSPKESHSVRRQRKTQFAPLDWLQLLNMRVFHDIMKETHESEIKTMKSEFRIIEKNGKCEISIDGQEIQEVTAYSIKHRAGGLPIIQLDVLASNLSFESDYLPALPKPWDAFYEPKRSMQGIRESVDESAGMPAEEPGLVQTA